MKNVSNQLRPLAEDSDVQQLADAIRSKTRKDGKPSSTLPLTFAEKCLDLTGTWVILTNGLFSEPYGMLKQSPRSSSGSEVSSDVPSVNLQRSHLFLALDSGPQLGFQRGRWS